MPENVERYVVLSFYLDVIASVIGACGLFVLVVKVLLEYLRLTRRRRGNRWN